MMQPLRAGEEPGKWPDGLFQRRRPDAPVLHACGM
jgi:hypothetical protein